MEHEGIAFAPLLIVVSLAFVVPLLLSRVRAVAIPVVVGEVVAGILVGPSGLGWVESNVMLTILADLGFVYLMFLSGLEISIPELIGGQADPKSRGLKRKLSNPLILSLTVFVLTLVLAGIASQLLLRVGLLQDPWIIALILSTTSLGVVVPVLKESGLLSQRYGQALLSAALVADFVAIVLISIYVLLKSEGLSAQLLLIIVLLAVFLAVYRLTGHFRAHLPAQQLFDRLSTATAQFKLRGAFALALLFVALAQSLGVEHILGAFLAGVILSMLSGAGHSDLREKLDAFGYSFFIPIFFVMVGVSFQLRELLGSTTALALVPVIVVTAYVVKIFPALLFRVAFNTRQALGAGVLLSTHLSLIIAASTIALQLDLISGAVFSALILVAVVTCTVSPIVFGKLVPDTAQERGVLIAGGGTVGRLLAEQLARDDEGVVVVEADAAGAEQIRGLQLANIHVVQGDATDPAVLEAAGIEEVRVVVAATQSDEANVRIAQLAKQRYNREQVVARVGQPETAAELSGIGVRALSPSVATATILSNLVRRPAMFSVLSGEIEDNDMDIVESRVRNRELLGRTLQDLGLPGDALLLLVRRNGERLVPHGRTRLELGDIVTIAGSTSDVRRAARLMGGPRRLPSDAELASTEG